MTYPSQSSLFQNIQKPIPIAIDGLTYIPNYINAAQADFLLRHSDTSPWLYDLTRRVQHYGYRYDYSARSVTKDAWIGALPAWLDEIAHSVWEDGFFSLKPDQVIVNEYLSGQGIAEHIDCVPCFGETIVSLSLGSGCIMEFSHTVSDAKMSIWLEPNSILVLSGEARYQWKHSIAKRKKDRYQETIIQRGRRVSFTFRTVLLTV